MKSNETKKRKSGFNPSRACYLTADGKYYCYERWDDDAKVNSYKADPDNEDSVDSWATFADKGGSPEDDLFAEPESENPQVVQVRRVIDEECTESQQDFFFEHFGEGTQLEEMRQAEAGQTGKLPSSAAMTNRKNKIIDKVAKSFGVERVKRHKYPKKDLAVNGGKYGGRSPPRPHIFGGLNFLVVSEEGNTSILRSNADQEQEDESMRLKHKVRINIADKSGNKQEVLQSEHRSIPKRLLTFLFGEFCEVLLLTPGESVRGIEIKEMRGDGNE